MSESERTITDEELDRAVEALSDPERFRAAEARVARAAPQLQRVLDQALDAGGWLGEAQEQQIRQAAGHDDPAERAAALRLLLGGGAHRDARRSGGRLGAGARA